MEYRLSRSTVVALTTAGTVRFWEVATSNVGEHSRLGYELTLDQLSLLFEHTSVSDALLDAPKTLELPEELALVFDGVRARLFREGEVVGELLHDHMLRGARTAGRRVEPTQS